MMRFGLIYRIWAFQAVRAIGPWGERTGLSFWVGARGPGVSMSLPFSLGLVSVLAHLFLKPYHVKLFLIRKKRKIVVCYFRLNFEYIYNI